MKRVLVVDDDSDILSLVRLVLSEEGYEVDTALNGGDALALLHETEPDLIYVDLAMPAMNGWEFLRAMRAEQLAPRTPVVLMSATALSEAELSAARAAGHLPKPFDLDVLVAQTARFIGTAAASA